MGTDKKKFQLPAVVIMIKNIISWTIIFLLAIVAAFLMYYLIRSKIAGLKGQDYQPSFAMYTIVSPSMVPNINVYDVILSKRVSDINEIKVGDIITFTSTSSLSSGMIITHRVIDIIDSSEIRLKTQGDNNLSPDPSYVNQKNLIGKVVLRIPKIGKIQRLLLSSGGWIIFIILPGLFLIFYDIRKLAKVKPVKVKQKLAEEPLPPVTEEPKPEITPPDIIQPTNVEPREYNFDVTQPSSKPLTNLPSITEWEKPKKIPLVAIKKVTTSQSAKPKMPKLKLLPKKKQPTNSKP